MTSIFQKLILLTLILAAALMSTPGLSRLDAKLQVNDSEAPSQTVEKLEFFEAAVVRQNRRQRLQRLEVSNQHEPLRLRFWQQTNSLLQVRTAHGIQSIAFQSNAFPGHRLANGLLAPLRI